MEFKLTKDQQRIHTRVDTTNDNYLIQGKPGVGKSVLIHSLVEDGDKNYTLAAPTGLAALNIGGRTLHSLFMLPVSGGIVHPTFNKFTINDNVLNFLKYKVHHLIIDEVSMVRADMFDYIDRLLRYVKNVDKPFGGVQMIVVGDFYQLPPVVVREEKQQLEQAGYDSPFIFSSRVFEDNFKVLELTEVLRQKGDNKFIKILDGARTGQLLATEIDAINKRVGPADDLRIRLAGTNAQADSVNQMYLNALPGDKRFYDATKFGDWPALPVEESLALKIGAQVMVKMNQADRPPLLKGEFISDVVNGTLGKIVEFVTGKEPVKEDEKPQTPHVKIELRSGKIVNIYQKRWERKIKFRNDEGDWDEKVIASYEQIPLSLAWAISMHKSQGQSFDFVHIDAEKIFMPGQLYVALSRARSLKGITLEAPVSASKFFADVKVTKFFRNVQISV